MPTASEPGFGLYIHWPFCQSKCPYCDFNSHVASHIDQDRWRQALLSELKHYAGLTSGRTLTSIFFGGGTPSLMDPETAGALISAARACWNFSEDLEITLEANPSTAEIGRFQAFCDNGINRLSLGVQSLRQDALTELGRGHDVKEACNAIEMAARIFPRYTFDLIYARPNQTPAEWAVELGEGLAMAGDHLSLYQLTVEPGTEFFRNGVLMAEENLAADLYEMTQDIMNKAGLKAYEISNHAKPGFESQHNLTYWRGGDYIGIGPGAHGRLTREGQTFACHQISKPDNWLEKVNTKGHATAKEIPLVPEQRAEELIMMGMRIKEGINAARFKQQCGLDLTDLLDLNAVQKFEDAGFLHWDQQQLAATEMGRQRLNGLLSQILS